MDNEKRTVTVTRSIRDRIHGHRCPRCQGDAMTNRERAEKVVYGVDPHNRLGGKLFVAITRALDDATAEATAAILAELEAARKVVEAFRKNRSGGATVALALARYDAIRGAR